MLAGEQLLKFLRNAVSPSTQSSELLGLFDLGEGRTILPRNVTMHQLTQPKVPKDLFLQDYSLLLRYNIT